MRRLHRNLLILAGVLAVGVSCVTITEEDPRRARGIFYPEPVPSSAWAPRGSHAPRQPAATAWIAPTGGPPAGVCVFLEGEGSGEELDPVLRRFSQVGFRVLRVRVEALVAPPLELSVDRPEQIDAVAGQLAAAVDTRLADVASQVRRLLAQQHQKEPDSPERPLVLGGVGLGACLVPAVAARLGESVDAAVLVGGGASLFEIVLAGSLATDGVDLQVGALTPAQLAYFGDVYLAESRLDPYHTARFLGGKPVLLVHARFDEVVPHWTGDILHARLGSPKRLRVLGDHEDLLDELEERAGWIVAWAEGAVATRR